ncbi:PIN domain-containing protein [Pseudomonas yamanorum]|uniref:PIN domain-containing protein n=1 Tax=Pseudomonas yamanorum TaxID=515393 RepID=UPI00384DF130
MGKPENLKSNDSQNDDLSLPAWALEECFPDASLLLKPSKIKSADDPDVLVVLDTNVLLVPYKVGGREFKEIKNALMGLAKSGRLKVPGRVIREFVSNRDGELSNILKAVQDKASSARNIVGGIPHCFKELVEAAPALDAAEQLKKAGAEYAKRLQTLIDRMKGWRGDDPVTQAYDEIFSENVVIDTKIDRSEVDKDWKARRILKRPPGYKDAGKDDGGIGDYLIWRTILEIGENHKQDLIFVTGEEKADWFVRSNRAGVYPRPELLDEYRRASGGGNLQILHLAELLSQVGVELEVVEDVREVEAAEAEAIRRAAPIAIAEKGLEFITFDYSTQNGEIRIHSRNGQYFDISFSKASDDSIHIYSCPGTRVARVKNAKSNQPLSFDAYDSSSRSYTVRIGEVFLVRNLEGGVLAARIYSIADDSRGADSDEVTFGYLTFQSHEQVIAPQLM